MLSDQRGLAVYAVGSAWAGGICCRVSMGWLYSLSGQAGGTQRQVTTGWRYALFGQPRADLSPKIIHINIVTFSQLVALEGN